MATKRVATIDEVVSAQISQALRHFSYNKTHTAKALGISRYGLLKMIKRFGITDTAPEVRQWLE